MKNGGSGLGHVSLLLHLLPHPAASSWDGETWQCGGGGRTRDLCSFPEGYVQLNETFEVLEISIWNQRDTSRITAIKFQLFLPIDQEKNVPIQKLPVYVYKEALFRNDTRFAWIRITHVYTY